jgi:hypothetical protein
MCCLAASAGVALSDEVLGPAERAVDGFDESGLAGQVLVDGHHVDVRPRTRLIISTPGG